MTFTITLLDLAVVTASMIYSSGVIFLTLTLYDTCKPGDEIGVALIGALLIGAPLAVGFL